MAKLTTTYNELKKLGACEDGLETLWKWILKTKGQTRGLVPPECNICEHQPLTPADILESNGVEFLNWVLARTPRWESSFYSWGGRWEGSSAWAKGVSTPTVERKVLAKDLKEGDRIRVGDARATVQGCYSDHVRLVYDGGGQGFNSYYGCLLDAIGFTLIKPKREPRRLKAEQILVPENVGTKWRKGGAVAEVQRHQIDCSSVGFWRVDEARWCNAFNNVIIGEWEEVLE